MLEYMKTTGQCYTPALGSDVCNIDARPCTVLLYCVLCGSWSDRLDEAGADGAVSWRYCVTSPNEAGLELKKIN